MIEERGTEIINGKNWTSYGLTGRGSVLKSHNGPLYDAITDSSDGTGETEYFKFKCFKNQNLHVEFKRLDLVARLNAVAGGARLREAKP
jgi:hypothetical protein